MIKNIDDLNFETTVLKNTKHVLVEFSASWCGPCKQLFPILEQVSEQYKDALEVCKIDIDESPDLAMKYQVKNIPLMLILKDGVVLSTKTGAMPKTKISSWIDETIK